MTNVLVFFTDQQRFDTTGVHGNPHGLTPHFDRMAREGVHVERSFTCQPVCAPSRASLQTGRYPTAIGCFRNGIPLPVDEPTLAHRFAAAGYETAYMGKWHLADDDVAGPVRPAQRGGYERWLTSNLLEFTSDAYETTLYDERGEPHDLPGYRADALTDAAISYLREPRDRPFFLFLSYLEPHHQNSRDDYPAPHGYAERYPDPWLPGDLAALDGNTREHLAGYYGMVRRVDECLGRLRGALEELGLTDDTVVLYTSDHGCHFKTRNDEYKRSCHDASIRVPTALTGPGFATGQPVPRLVSHLDLPPTLLDAAGIAVPPEMDGRSLLPALHGDPDPRPDDSSSRSASRRSGEPCAPHAGSTQPSHPGRTGGRRHRPTGTSTPTSTTWTPTRTSCTTSSAARLIGTCSKGCGTGWRNGSWTRARSAR